MEPRRKILVLVILVYGIRGTDAQSRVFTTCAATQAGVQSSSAIDASIQIATFCSSTPTASVESAPAPSIAVTFTQGNATATAQTSVTTGGVPEASAGSEVAISSSSTGGVPFSVSGGDPPDVGTAERRVRTRASSQRPFGIWFTIVSVDVTRSPSAVWAVLRNLGAFMSLSLRGLGASVRSQGGGEYRILLDSGEGFTVISDAVDQRRRFHTAILADISSNVFPGFNFDGTRLYFQVSSNGFESGATNIEIGWGVDFGNIPSGNLRIGIRLVEALLLEMLENLEARFGQRCEFGRNIRTIEGDCNNLRAPAQGSSGSPLRRLGRTDPAYPQNNRNQPSGAVDISPRDISNKLFAMSPGTALLLEQSESLTECIEGITESGEDVTLCPLESVTLGESTVIPIKEIRANEKEELVFVYSTPGCTINALFKCSGESSVDFAEEPCGAKTNRFFDPLACTLKPGADSVLANSDGLTDLFFTFGQFIDHDVGLTPTSQIARNQPGFSRNSRPINSDEFPIEIPSDDHHFPNQDEFMFERARFSAQVPNSHVNQHSSYLDGSQIYGVNFLRARVLRSFEGGKLDLSDGDFPPFNAISGPGALGSVVDNAPNTDGRFFVVGDVRGNEQSLLLALHICFLREHNLVADELAALFPDFDDERLYQTARAIVIAEYQSIVYNEWLPRLLGSSAPSSSGFSYSDRVDASISAIFSTSAFRFGHSMVGTNLLRMGSGPRTSATMTLVPIRDVFFVPELVQGSGMDEFLRGGAWHAAKEVDHLVVDELRNFLITGEGMDTGTTMLFDLISLNIQRGRDMGIPSFNEVRRLFGLRPCTSFRQFISDDNLADLASEVYEGDVDNVDVFVGGLLEKRRAGSQLGQTFHTIIADQFRRLRDGDRFFYSGIRFDPILMQRMPRLNRIFQNKITLRDIILRNTRISASELGLKPSVFQL